MFGVLQRVAAVGNVGAPRPEENIMEHMINAVMALVAQHPVLAAVAAAVAVFAAFAAVRTIQYSAWKRAQDAAQAAAEAEWKAKNAKWQAQFEAEEAEREAEAAAYRKQQAAYEAAHRGERVAKLRHKAVIAIRWRNGLLASKEAMTWRRYEDFIAELAAANKAVKAAIAELGKYPTNDNWMGSDLDENWLCQNFGPRV